MAAASFKFTPTETAGVVDVEVLNLKDDKIYPQLAVVHRLRLKNWKVGPGVYILVDPIPNAEGKHDFYVGQSREGGVGKRIKSHFSNPPVGMETWIFAVVVHGNQRLEPNKKNTKLTHEEARALEYILLKELKDIRFIELKNKKLTGGDKDLTGEGIDYILGKKLEEYIPHIINLFKVLGIDIRMETNKDLAEKIISGYSNKLKKITLSADTPDTPDRNPRPELKDLIQAGLIEVGTKLVSRPGKYECEAEIFDKEGNIQVLGCKKSDEGNWINELSDNPAYRYKTLGRATKVINKFYGVKINENGWEFWRLADDPKISMKKLRDEYRKQQS